MFSDLPPGMESHQGNNFALRSIIPLDMAVTLLAGLLYVSVQQVLRQDANDPQIGMAEDAAAALAAGQALPETPPVDIAARRTLECAPFRAAGLGPAAAYGVAVSEGRSAERACAAVPLTGGAAGAGTSATASRSGASTP